MISVRVGGFYHKEKFTKEDSALALCGTQSPSLRSFSYCFACRSRWTSSPARGPCVATKSGSGRLVLSLFSRLSDRDLTLVLDQHRLLIHPVDRPELVHHLAQGGVG